MLKRARVDSVLAIGEATFLDLMNTHDSSDMNAITLKLSGVQNVPSLHEEIVRFECKTVAKWPKYKHYVKVTDKKQNRWMPLQSTKWFINHELDVFADMILSFVQSLVGYASRQESFVSMAADFRVPVRLLPASLSWDVEQWEKEFKVPILGTDDILGSFMKNPYEGRLSLSDWGL